MLRKDSQKLLKVIKVTGLGDVVNRIGASAFRSLTIFALSIFLIASLSAEATSNGNSANSERMFETTFTSKKIYSDPFNDVDVDVIFCHEQQTWRVPAYWQGGSRWSVRFAPPITGLFSYRLESTDRSNPELNGQGGQVAITAYSGSNVVLRRGMLRVSANKRYFEHDGTPFFWLGDTWYNGPSDRLSWEDFKKLAADRKAKGFAVVKTAIMAVTNEEVAPGDPAFHNEGGSIWEPGFKTINPAYFDYADRRLKLLVELRHRQYVDADLLLVQNNVA